MTCQYLKNKQNPHSEAIGTTINATSEDCIKHGNDLRSLSYCFQANKMLLKNHF